MRYRVTWCSLSSPVACHAKMGVRMYEQPSCICHFARRGSTPNAERSGNPRSAPGPTLEGGANLH
eukprot:7377474-Prymnesium_polylepis.1